MISPLDNLCGHNKPLAAEPPDAAEFAGLKRSGLARLQDASHSSLSLEGRFDLAYNAAHALSLAALRWHGYRAGNRYIVFQVLPHTLAWGRRSGACWRNAMMCATSEYEGDLNVDARIVSDLITACKAVATALDKLPPPR